MLMTLYWTMIGRAMVIQECRVLGTTNGTSNWMVYRALPEASNVKVKSRFTKRLLLLLIEDPLGLLVWLGVVCSEIDR